MSSFRTPALLNDIRINYSIYGDIRDFQNAAEVLDVHWWFSDNTLNAGEQLAWQGRILLPPNTPITLRYKRLCPLKYAIPQDPSGGGPVPPPVYVDSGAKLLIDGSHFRAANKVMEEVFISRVQPDPDPAVVYNGAVDMVRAIATFDVDLSPTTNLFNYKFDMPTPIVYIVTAATGKWATATNVIINYEFDKVIREVSIVRGIRCETHASGMQMDEPELSLN
jgi:hypothetical protein